MPRGGRPKRGQKNLASTEGTVRIRALKGEISKAIRGQQSEDRRHMYPIFSS